MADPALGIGLVCKLLPELRMLWVEICVGVRLRDWSGAEWR
jgi:hypothetical protein